MLNNNMLKKTKLEDTALNVAVIFVCMDVARVNYRSMIFIPSFRTDSKVIRSEKSRLVFSYSIFLLHTYVTVKAQRLVNPRFDRYILACAVVRW
jgi:hypothetical protein